MERIKTLMDVYQLSFSFIGLQALFALPCQNLRSLLREAALRKRIAPLLLLPRPQSITARGISLYSHGEPVSLDFGPGLTAVVGANGLGKSTLLNLVLYAFTGMVRKPGADFVASTSKTPRGFLATGEAYADNYFDGRIQRDPKNPPYVSATFRLGTQVVVVERGFFERRGVVRFRTTGDWIQIDAEREYRTQVCRLSGTSSFEQFTFFVQTLQAFGEDRLCLFFENEALNQLVRAATTGDPQDAARLAGLMQEYKKFDSHVRNLQWTITREKNLLRQLTDQLTNQGKTVPEDLLGQYKERAGELASLQQRLRSLTIDRSQVLARRDEYELSLSSIRRQLDEITLRALRLRVLSIDESPLLIPLLRDLDCPICRTKHEACPHEVVDRLRDGKCPLCSAEVQAHPNNVSMKDTIRIDLAETRVLFAEETARLEHVLAEISGLEQEVASVSQRIDEASAWLSAADDEFGAAAIAAARAAGTPSGIGGAVAEITKKIRTFTAQKADYKRQRDAAKTAMTRIQEEQLVVFQRVKSDLVPRFETLARGFLGVELSLSAGYSRSPDGMPLISFNLSVLDTARTRPEQLSESQRYFLDIALRMTLLSWISSDDGSAFLIVDTPEGSLDIAYETNAGAMFGSFLARHRGGLLTASNLNSSNLMREAVKEASIGGAAVQLFDLREWGSITSVQRNHSSKLDAQIEELKRISTSSGLGE